MYREGFSRREFLNIWGLSIASIFINPISLNQDQLEAKRTEIESMTGRITDQFVYVYKQPDFLSDRIRKINRDHVVQFEQLVISPTGPNYNPRWYKLTDGYVHSGYVQRVESARMNQPMKKVREGGQLGEITLPYIRSYRTNNSRNWTPLYRLYFQSVHWITEIQEGPDGEPWYCLTDERLNIKHYVPAYSMRPIPIQELMPISTNIPPDDKWIELTLDDQTLRAYERNEQVLETKVSTGIPGRTPSPNGIPTDTPSGHFRITSKMPSRHMGDGELNPDINAYELVGVPWVSYFHFYGIALHGTYWHDNFGRRMSHGCVNMRNEDALWIYRWVRPIIKPWDWRCTGVGTRIRII